MKALAMAGGSCGEGNETGQSRQDAGDGSAKAKESSSHRVILEKAPHTVDSEKRRKNRREKLRRWPSRVKPRVPHQSQAVGAQSLLGWRRELQSAEDLHP